MSTTTSEKMSIPIYVYSMHINKLSPKEKKMPKTFTRTSVSGRESSIFIYIIRVHLCVLNSTILNIRTHTHEMPEAHNQLVNTNTEGILYIFSNI